MKYLLLALTIWSTSALANEVIVSKGYYLQIGSTNSHAFIGLTEDQGANDFIVEEAQVLGEITLNQIDDLKNCKMKAKSHVAQVTQELVDEESANSQPELEVYSSFVVTSVECVEDFGFFDIWSRVTGRFF